MLGNEVSDQGQPPVAIVTSINPRQILQTRGGLVFGVGAMANFLPFGTQGSLLSGGIIPLLNVAVGIEVAGGITLILTEFLDYALLRPKATE